MILYVGPKHDRTKILIPQWVSHAKNLGIMLTDGKNVGHAFGNENVELIEMSLLNVIQKSWCQL